LQLLYGNAMQMPGGIDVDALKDAAKELFEAFVKDGAKTFSIYDWKDLLKTDKVTEILEGVDVPGLDSSLLEKIDIKPFDKDKNGKLSLDELVAGLTNKETLKVLGATLAGGALQNLVPSPIWDTVTTTLRLMTQILPTAVDNLKFARLEVSAVSSQLSNVFENFHKSGAKVFNTVARLNKIAWTVYYFLLAPLTCGILYYGFYASGYFGGPKAIEEEEYVPPEGFMDRLAACWRCCCNCVTEFEDTAFCLWSMILVMQIIVLLIFIVSILLTILAGVKVFITASCAQVYIINDDKVCTETMHGISKFLESFYVGEVPTSLDFICETKNLKTCQQITQKMMTSTIYTVVGSFAATIFSFELILNTAMLHERSRWRRIADKRNKEEKSS